MRKGLVKLVLLVAFIFLLKLFVIEAFMTSSNSMNACLWEGDYLLVNKIVYGIRSPKGPSDIPWFNLFALNRRLNPWFRNTEWPYWRWPMLKVTRNDVVVFEPPWPSQVVLVKRCVALPGDSLEIDDDKLIINAKEVVEPNSIQYVYNVDRDLQDMSNISDLEISKYWHAKNDRAINSYNLPKHIAREIAVRNQFATLKVATYLNSEESTFGPIKVPQKGTVINFSKLQKFDELYFNIINQFEKSFIERGSDGIIRIDGKVDSVYTFKKNYFFMMGDNRSQSEDSRIWGFVPEENILGKARMVLFFREPSSRSINWTRSFRLID
jgi:signal peptidase I